MSDSDPLVDGVALSALRVVDLRDHLEKRGLDKKGNKKELTERLLEYILANETDKSVDVPAKEKSVSPRKEGSENPMVAMYKARQQELLAAAEAEKRKSFESKNTEVGASTNEEENAATSEQPDSAVESEVKTPRKGRGRSKSRIESSEEIKSPTRRSARRISVKEHSESTASVSPPKMLEIEENDDEGQKTDEDEQKADKGEQKNEEEEQKDDEDQHEREDRTDDSRITSVSSSAAEQEVTNVECGDSAVDSKELNKEEPEEVPISEGDESIDQSENTRKETSPKKESTSEKLGDLQKDSRPEQEEIEQIESNSESEKALSATSENVEIASSQEDEPVVTEKHSESARDPTPEVELPSPEKDKVDQLPTKQEESLSLSASESVSHSSSSNERNRPISRGKKERSNSPASEVIPEKRARISAPDMPDDDGEELDYGDEDMDGEHTRKKVEEVTVESGPVHKAILPEDDGFKRVKEVSPCRYPVSEFVHIRGLTRPFTMPQLRQLIEKNGTITDIWIDGIKSHCIVQLSSSKDATLVREALHNVVWPTSNPKSLSVQFTNKEQFVRYKDGEQPKTVSVRGGHQESSSSKTSTSAPVAGRTLGLPGRNTSLRVTVEAAVRENEKIRQTGAEERVRDEKDDRASRQTGSKRNRSETPPHSRGNEKRERRDERSRRDVEKESRVRRNSVGEEETVKPIRTLEELFRKTKTQPALYWLPLTDKQAEERAKHLEEVHKRRLEERDKRDRR